jgi:2-polyprenyl-3-methyl-5-hydroxy-6-metoxy-1,4-benzoquinol methylase
LRHLRRLNRIFAAAGPTLYGVKRLWAEAGKPRRLTVLDIGSGSGDVNQRLLRWAEQNGVDLRLILADITAEACAEARLFYWGEERVQVTRRDLFALPEGAADVVTAAQFLHHFSDEQLPAVLRQMLHASRIGVVINDIHRHWIPWLAVWIATRLLSRNRYIRNDGPLSVAKGFRSSEWRRLKKDYALPIVSYSWRPLFRYAVIVRKAYADAAQAAGEGAERR